MTPGAYRRSYQFIFQNRRISTWESWATFSTIPCSPSCEQFNKYSQDQTKKNPFNKYRAPPFSLQIKPTFGRNTVPRRHAAICRVQIEVGQWRGLYTDFRTKMEMAAHPNVKYLSTKWSELMCNWISPDQRLSIIMSKPETSQVVAACIDPVTMVSGDWTDRTEGPVAGEAQFWPGGCFHFLCQTSIPKTSRYWWNLRLLS